MPVLKGLLEPYPLAFTTTFPLPNSNIYVKWLLNFALVCILALYKTVENSGFWLGFLSIFNALKLFS